MDHFFRFRLPDRRTVRVFAARLAAREHGLGHDGPVFIFAHRIMGSETGIIGEQDLEVANGTCLELVLQFHIISEENVA